MDTNYTQTGNYTALAGVAVLFLSKFGVNTDVATVLTIIGGIVAVVGVVKQFLDHKNLAIKTGSYK